MTTKREWERRQHLAQTLIGLGFTADEVEQLRRISNTLRRWHELECGTGDFVMQSVERENADGTGRPFLRTQYPTRGGYRDTRRPIADREAGAKKRLAAIVDGRNARGCHKCDPGALQPCGPECLHIIAPTISAYIQGDPRGAALYLLRPGDVPEGKDAGAYYTRGICVY